MTIINVAVRTLLHARTVADDELRKTLHTKKCFYRFITLSGEKKELMMISTHRSIKARTRNQEDNTLINQR